MKPNEAPNILETLQVKLGKALNLLDKKQAELSSMKDYRKTQTSMGVQRKTTSNITSIEKSNRGTNIAKTTEFAVKNGKLMATDKVFEISGVKGGNQAKMAANAISGAGDNRGTLTAKATNAPNLVGTAIKKAGETKILKNGQMAKLLYDPFEREATPEERARAAKEAGNLATIGKFVDVDNRDLAKAQGWTTGIQTTEASVKKLQSDISTLKTRIGIEKDREKEKEKQATELEKKKKAKHEKVGGAIAGAGQAVSNVAGGFNLGRSLR